MVTLKSKNGTAYETADVPAGYEPAYCSECGCRVCWWDETHGDEPVLVCEDCIAVKANERGE